jgi:hypothetical protein
VRVAVLALRAAGADQALRANQVDRARHQERLDAHVHQAADRARRVVGVQRRQHQVPGQRRLDRDLRRLEVADLADQDDVGVLAQERAAAPPAKFRPMFSRTWTWLTPTRLNSTGSSAVMMLVSEVLILAIDEYSVLVLPLPVGP